MNNHSCVMEALMKIPSYDIVDKMENMLNIASDSTRIKILYCLLDDDSGSDNKVEKTVSEIMEEISASQSLVSHQLKVLKDARLIVSRKQGKNVFYSLCDRHVKLLLEVVYEHIIEEEDEND